MRAPGSLKGSSPRFVATPYECAQVPRGQDMANYVGDALPPHLAGFIDEGPLCFPVGRFG